MKAKGRLTRCLAQGLDLLLFAAELPGVDALKVLDPGCLSAFRAIQKTCLYEPGPPRRTST